MGDSVLFRFNGQAGYEVDCGHHKKIRVVFGMIDEDRTKVAWYLFASTAEKKSQQECEKAKASTPDKFGHRDAGGRDIPHTFEKKIGLDELAINPKGTPATLTLEIGETKRFIECRIDKLKTKEKEVVTFPFGLQYDSDPSRTGEIPGKVLFLEIAPFDAKKFPLGPQGKEAQSSITGPVL